MFCPDSHLDLSPLLEVSVPGRKDTSFTLSVSGEGVFTYRFNPLKTYSSIHKPGCPISDMLTVGENLCSTLRFILASRIFLIEKHIAHLNTLEVL